MTGFAIFWLIVAGFALALPGPPKKHGGSGAPVGNCWGVRFLTSASVLLGFLFVAHVVLAVPYHVAVWGALGLAIAAGAVSVIVTGRRAARSGLAAPGGILDLCAHPVTVLTAVVGLVALLTTRFAYLPYLGDEFSNWIGWAVQLVAADTYKVSVPVISYTPGWALLMGVPGGVTGQFDVDQVLAIPFLLHVGLLGCVYDAVLAVSGRDTAAGMLLRRLVAWAAVLSLLAVEASWKLVPTNLLIERPQVTLLTAAFVGFAMMQFVARGRMTLGLMAGSWIAAGYLIKVAMLVAVPFLGVLACAAFFWRRADEPAAPLPTRLGRAAAKGALCMAPFAAVYLLWSMQALPSHCMGQPTDTLDRKSVV